MSVGRKQFDDTTDDDIKLSAPTAGSNKLPPGKKSRKKSSEHEELLARVRKRFDRCVSAEADNRRAELDDKKFLTGEGQWPADVMAQRNFDRRPCLTINKLPTFLNQITNDQRQNRPSINVSPVGDKSDPEVAKMYRGLIRAIERDSAADIAYDTAFADSAAIGEGYWLVSVDYADEDTFNQVLRIVRIRNRFTVYLDPDHQDPTGADAKYGFITDLMSKDEYRERWPKADPMNFVQSGIGEKMVNWISGDMVRIAEYFEIKNEMRDLVELSTGHVGWKDELSDAVLSKISSGSIEIEQERRSPCPKVTWYKVNGVEVLEETPWLGRWVPIVKVTGNEVDVEGKLKLSGIIRQAKGPQLIYNYMSTLEVELTGLQPKAPYIAAEGQIEGHENEWKMANINAASVLTYKPESINGQLLPAPQRQPFQTAPMGVVQAAQKAAQDMMATTGIRFDATLQERVVDESGRALREIRRSGDLGSFHYVDNLARSLKRCGEILIDLIPKIYTRKQIVTILREDDSEEQVQIDPHAQKATSEMRYSPNHPTSPNKVLKIFNPTIGKYGVTVTIGPNSATKRIETAESMMDFMRAVPTVAPAVVDLLAKNMDWPGSEEFAARLAKLVAIQNPGIMTADPKDVPPQVMAIMNQMNMQIQQLSQERMAMLKELNDKTADRQIEVDKINKDFEAKLLKVVTDVETKMAATQEKAVASFNAHIGSKVEHLAQEVQGVIKTLETPSKQEEPSRKERHEDSEKHHKMLVDALGSMSDKFATAISQSNKRPKKIKIVRGDDGFATGAEFEDGVD